MNRNYLSNSIEQNFLISALKFNRFNFLDMSTESLEIYYRNMLNENVDNESLNENRNEMSISLDDLYDKISLYDYDESNPK